MRPPSQRDAGGVRVGGSGVWVAQERESGGRARLRREQDGLLEDADGVGGVPELREGAPEELRGLAGPREAR